MIEVDIEDRRAADMQIDVNLASWLGRREDQADDLTRHAVCQHLAVDHVRTDAGP